jgi:hypothetical protein
MKEKRLCLVLLVVSQISFSQIRGVVKDSISGIPIPYATIFIENENTGTTTEIDGSFILDVKEDKKLIISALGYHVKKTAINNETIFLKPKIIELNEVVIEKSKNNKQLEIGKTNTTKVGFISGEESWINSKYFQYDTIYKNTKFISKINFYTKSKVKNAKFKLRLYNINQDGFPGSDILSEDVIVTVKKGNHKTVIDISSHHIVFPKTGFFVGYEILKIESNKYDFKYTEFNSTKTITKVFFAPSFECNLSDEENTFTFQKGKWQKRPRWHNNETGSFKKFNNKILEPSIHVVLTN